MGARSHRDEAGRIGRAGRVALPIAAELRGRLVRRYKRFLADVRLEDGRVVTVHCPDPGSMRGCARPGAAVRCSRDDRPHRRLPHTLEMVRVGRVWVGVHTARANALAAAGLAAGALAPLAGYASLRREVAPPAASPARTDFPESRSRLDFPESRSRLDFLLEGHPRDPRPLWLEVKSVTLAEGRAGRFPDSVTERGRRHAELLARLHRAGARAALLFVVQRSDCRWVEPADDLDPDYGRALRAAARAGVELYGMGVSVSPGRLAVTGMLPVRL